MYTEMLFFNDCLRYTNCKTKQVEDNSEFLLSVTRSFGVS